MQGTEYTSVQVSNLKDITKNGEYLGTRGWMTVRDEDNKFQWSGAFVAWGSVGATLRVADTDSNPEATGGDVLFTVEEDANRNRKAQAHSPVFHVTGYHSKRAPRQKGGNWMDQFVIDFAEATL